MRRSFPFGDNSTLMEKCNRISVEQELRKKYDKNEWQAVKDDYGVGWLETVDGSKADIFLDVMEEQHKETEQALDLQFYLDSLNTRRIGLIIDYARYSKTIIDSLDYDDVWLKLLKANVDMNEYKPDKFEFVIESADGWQTLEPSRFAQILFNEEE